MIPREGKIRSNLIDDIVLVVTPAERKAISPANVDLAAIAIGMVTHGAIEVVLGRVLDRQRSGDTEEGARTAASAVGVEQSTKKTKAKSTKITRITNQIEKIKRVKRAVVGLHQDRCHDIHE